MPLCLRQRCSDFKEFQSQAVLTDKLQIKHDLHYPVQTVGSDLLNASQPLSKLVRPLTSFSSQNQYPGRTHRPRTVINSSWRSVHQRLQTRGQGQVIHSQCFVHEGHDCLGVKLFQINTQGAVDEEKCDQPIQVLLNEVVNQPKCYGI